MIPVFNKGKIIDLYLVCDKIIIYIVKQNNAKLLKGVNQYTNNIFD